DYYCYSTDSSGNRSGLF
nr:immunoglobulin light chain junction region [Macaca mulatta]